MHWNTQSTHGKFKVPVLYMNKLQVLMLVWLQEYNVCYLNMKQRRIKTCHNRNVIFNNTKFVEKGKESMFTSATEQLYKKFNNIFFI